MNNSNPQAGFSILDMIIGLSIISIAVVGILLAQGNFANSAAQTEVGLKAVSLGNYVMQTIRKHRFDEETNTPWSTSYGTDTGESSSSDYDDIDDYANASWDFSSDGYLGYTISTRVFCVDLSNSWVDSVGPGSDFKRIIVQVNHDALDNAVVLSSLYAGIIPFQ